MSQIYVQKGVGRQFGKSLEGNRKMAQPYRVLHLVCLSQRLTGFCLQFVCNVLAHEFLHGGRSFGDQWFPGVVGIGAISYGK